MRLKSLGHLNVRLKLETRRQKNLPRRKPNPCSRARLHVTRTVLTSAAQTWLLKLGNTFSARVSTIKAWPIALKAPMNVSSCASLLKCSFSSIVFEIQAPCGFGVVLLVVVQLILLI